MWCLLLARQNFTFKILAKVFEMAKKIPSCPKCRSKSVAVIVYGYPADMDAFLKGVEDGVFVPRGCCIGEDDPIWHCNQCNFEFGSRFTTLEELSK